VSQPDELKSHASSFTHTFQKFILRHLYSREVTNLPLKSQLLPSKAPSKLNSARRRM